VSTVPVVSVVMPIHRSPAAYFTEAIASVRAQSMPDWELVIVLDAATPECAEIARQAAFEDPSRIIVVGETGTAPRGASAARNLGIAIARAGQLAFLDADDMFEPDALRVRSAMLAAHPGAGMVYGLTLYWRSWNGRLVRNWLPELGVATGLHAPPSLVVPLLTGAASVPCQGSVQVRREAVDAIGGFNPDFPDLYDDQVFLVRMALRWPIVVHDLVLDRYRKHPNSMTAKMEDHDTVVRERFLASVEAELVNAGTRAPAITSAIAGERWKLRHPRLTSVGRLSRKAMKRLLRLGRR
jgi:glycosyltransferase involved in cell wall biosynthesis